jgi:hypothetical protein
MLPSLFPRPLQLRLAPCVVSRVRARGSLNTSQEDISLPPYQASSGELIAKLVRAGYLRPERQHDPDAVANAIARMKEFLRSGDRRQATA